VISGFILAAGEGRRLRPATLVRPKALVPFCGVPLLELAVAHLHGLGLDSIGVNVHYQGERVYEAARRLESAYGVDICISQEEQLLDTGGGLRHGVQKLRNPEHILVHNVDIILDFDLSELIDRHLAENAAATLLMVPGRGPRTVDLDADGRIADFRRPRGAGAFTFAGVHLLRRDLLDLLPDRPVCSIIEAYERALAEGLPVVAHVVDDSAYWADLGTADQYIAAHGDIADCALRTHPTLRAAQGEQARRRAALEQRDIQCTGALGLGVGLGVPSGSHLHNVVLWDYTRLPRPLLYADGIFVGDDVPPPRPVDDDRLPDPRIYAALGVAPEDTTLTPLQKQGSGRKYSRLKTPDASWVWCAYNPERRENAGFAAIADFLHRLGIRVPRVELHLADAFELLSHDLGQHDLQRATPMKKADYLFQVVEQIARLHVLGDQAARLEELPLRKGFTKGLYDWERDYFREHILGNLLERPDLWAPVARIYCELRTKLLREPLVPIHRDLQSANIMIVDNQVHLIDFQGMRLGCAAYDLGALLYDPYQSYDARLRNRLWRAYCACVKQLGGTPPAVETLRAAAFQRLLQALGAYGKLWLKDGLEWYRPYILTGLRMLEAVACELDSHPSLRVFAETCLSLACARLNEESEG
jgi:aminoglycoside/choline kinase family phosphotransferase/dTDP-glucose pyrophosphorylase